MTLDQFQEELEILHGYFDKSPKPAVVKAWYRKMQTWDFDLFRQVVAEFANMQESGDGRMSFPHIGVVITAYNRLKRGGKETAEVPSCKYCEHGKIYLEKDLGNGLWSQPYVFRCGECDPWQFKKFHPMYPARLDEYEAKGWRVEWVTKQKWDKVKAGTWLEEDEKLSPAKTGALLRGMGIGKESEAKERTRQAVIKAAEQTGIPF